MKKIILSLICAISLYSSNFQPAHAIIVYDPTNFALNVKDSIVQKFQLARDVWSSTSNSITALQQTLETVNNNILIPMRDAMTVIMIMKSGDAMKNLIMGSLGVDPLLVKNPEAYLKNKALSSVEANLGVIAGQKSLYGNSVLASLISANRYNYADVSTKLRAINQSSIPAAMQKKVCEDSMLSQLAREDVLAGSKDGNVDPVAYGDRKRELNRALCSGNPDTNPALAETLRKLSIERPDIGGWDSWLAMTSGDNPYNKAAQSQIVIDQKAQEIIERAKNDLTTGGGIKSLTECKRYADYDMSGEYTDNSNTAPCVLEEIKKSGAMLSSAFNEALNAPLKLMTASFGKGAGGLISTAFTSINLIQGISSAMDSITGSNGGSSGGVPVSPPNTANVIVSSSTPARDLANNPGAKETLTSPAKQQLYHHQETLVKLEGVDSNYLATIDLYQNKLAAMKSCYDRLAADYSLQEDSRLVAANNYYQNKTNSNSTLRTTITNEIRLIGTTKTLVANTISSINASQSSEEILNIFNAYQSRVDAQGLPSMTSGGTREGEYLSFKTEVDQANMEGGDLFTFNNDCATIRQQIEASNFTGAGA